MTRFITALILALATLTAQAAVDANKASQAELEAVKGIGPSMATRILDARSKSPFGNWADLIERVRGMGTGNAARLSQAGLTVGGAEFTAAAPAAPSKERQPRRAAKAEATTPVAAKP